jgi:hypothetical protein
MALSPEEHQNLLDRILDLFQSNEASIEYGDDPGKWVDENLPEGTTPEDVAECMPEVGERLGGPYQHNLSHYTSHGGAATHSVVNEISYTYNTVYQQNAFIYAEEGAQVSNIQGDGNTVTQVQIDDSFDVDLPREEDVEEPVDEPVEDPTETPEDPAEDPMDDPEDPEEEPEDPWQEPEEPWEAPEEPEQPEETPEDTPEDVPEETPEDTPDV